MTASLCPFVLWNVFPSILNTHTTPLFVPTANMSGFMVQMRSTVTVKGVRADTALRQSKCECRAGRHRAAGQNLKQGRVQGRVRTVGLLVPYGASELPTVHSNVRPHRAQSVLNAHRNGRPRRWLCEIALRWLLLST